MRFVSRVLLAILIYTNLDDIFVGYEEKDAIFELAKEIDKEFMEVTEGPDAATTCACCNKFQAKMKNCQFCGTVNCGQCLGKQRPYPKENPQKERRGANCLPCNKKFLYRDLKHELAVKAESALENMNLQTSPAQLEEEMMAEELNYTRLLNQLRDFKEIKAQQYDATKEPIKDDKESRITEDIKNLIEDKDTLLETLNDTRKLAEEKTRKIE